MIPYGALHNDTTRVMFATIAEPAPRSISRIAERAGMTRNRVWMELAQLRKHGLVTWDESKTGTLRPLVEQVAL